MTARQRHLPGEPGLWVLIFLDLGLFSLCFVLAMIDRAAAPARFAAGTTGLDVWLGMTNTIVLLTGSWAVAMGTRVERDPVRGARWLRLAAASGGLFLLLKAREWQHHLAGGHGFDEDRFQTWYWFLTGFHALHVILAMLLLLLVAGRMRRGAPCSMALTEAAGCYWHLVDLLWVGIFLVVYLV